MDKDKPAPLPIAFAAGDVGPKAAPVFIPKKQSAGDIEPGIITLLDSAPTPVKTLPNSTGRRTALAEWLTQKDNFLTASVMANRVWQQHFGRGLAANASDFGMLGEKPSHPELLDWLAAWFMQDGWSLKKLHRIIVTSATYRRSSLHPSPQAGQLADPENRLLWRGTPRRLDAEQIRDALPATSGKLEPLATGPGKTSEVPVGTVFTRFMRNTRDPLADVFDAPLWFASAASRDTTTTPVQSLLLANSANMRALGEAFAQRLETIAPNDSSAQIKAACELAFGRPATNAELTSANTFLEHQSAQSDTLRLASGQANFIPGQVFFALKDLSNDDEPLLTATVEHPVTGGWGNQTLLTIAARSGPRPNSFHGLIDDVRLSNIALTQGQLLYTADSIPVTTLGCWRFESKPDVLADSSPFGHSLAPSTAAESTNNQTPQQAALTDFCHALFNSSEFLYVE